MAKKDKDPSSTATNTGIAANVATSAVGMSAVAMLDFSKVVDPEKVENLISELNERVNAAVEEGKRTGLEAMLMGQAIALQSIFANFAHGSAASAGQHLRVTATYLKLALRAQSQCRATLETLAMIKTPPMVYASQANVTTGPRQINNGAAREIGSVPTRLLEAKRGQRLDTGTKGKADRAHSGMEAVGAVDRTQN